MDRRITQIMIFEIIRDILFCRAIRVEALALWFKLICSDD